MNYTLGSAQKRISATLFLPQKEKINKCRSPLYKQTKINRENRRKDVVFVLTGLYNYAGREKEIQQRKETVMPFSLNDRIWFVAYRDYHEGGHPALGDWYIISVDEWDHEANLEWNCVLKERHVGYHYALCTWSLRSGITVLAMTNKSGHVDWSLATITNTSDHYSMVHKLCEYLEGRIIQDGLRVTTNVSESESVA